MLTRRRAVVPLPAPKGVDRIALLVPLGQLLQFVLLKPPLRLLRPQRRRRCFNKLKQWRGIAMRTGKTARNYHAAICLA